MRAVHPSMYRVTRTRTRKLLILIFATVAAFDSSKLTNTNSSDVWWLIDFPISVNNYDEVLRYNPRLTETEINEEVQSDCSRLNIEQAECEALKEFILGDPVMTQSRSTAAKGKTPFSLQQGEIQRGRGTLQREKEPVPFPHKQIAEMKAAHGELRLNIGGSSFKDGWVQVNIKEPSGTDPEERVDIVRAMDRLDELNDGSVDTVYSSHTLEHIGYGDGAVNRAINEWARLLKNGGLLYLAVPDMSALAYFLSDEAALTAREQRSIIHQVYGGQTDAYDYHYNGFTFKLLEQFLLESSFCRIQRVTDFGLFSDTSNYVYKGRRMSLNVRAVKC